MTMPPPPRGPLTTWLHALLVVRLAAGEPPALLGDGIAPDGSGWVEGQPGAGDFAPYGVLKTLQATTPGRPPVSDPAAAWVVPYQLTSWGAVREQADYVADLLTAAVSSIAKVRPEDSPIDGFGIQLVQMTVLGTTDRSDQTSPQLWSRTDSLEVRVARARTR